MGKTWGCGRGEKRVPKTEQGERMLKYGRYRFLKNIGDGQ